MNAEPHVPTDWLLEGSSFVRYRTLIDLHGLDARSVEAEELRGRIPDDPSIKRILMKRNELGYWGNPEDLFKWWPKKDTTFWVLGVLGDFGLKREDWDLERPCEYVFGTQLEDGAFGVRPPPRSYDCFTGILVEALAKLGYIGDDRLEKAYTWLITRQRLDSGFWCKNTGQLGGPRQGEPSCAFATLCVLGALAVHPEYRESKIARQSANFLLTCWEKRGHMKYAGHDSQIGSGWERLKYPFTDYRILKYLDTLSFLPSVRTDRRVQEMITLLVSKRDNEDRFRPESIHKVWGDFDFGQKKKPSRWITFLVYRVLRRLGQSADAF
jgi:hypothetical protein